VITRSSRLGTLQPVAVGLVGVILLASLFFGLRGLVMLTVEPVRVQHHEPAPKHDTGKTHNHFEHCPLCFLQVLVPSQSPNPGLGHPILIKLHLGLEDRPARDELLQATAARGPPQP
jgi:hypothetical protein